MFSTNVTRARFSPKLFLLPVFLIMVSVIIFPVFDTIRLSFFDSNFMMPGLDAPFVGLKNYAKALSDDLFWYSCGVTLKWAGFSVALQFLLGLYLAMLLNARVSRSERSALAIRVLRSFFLIPWMLPGSLAAIIWKWMYHGSVGLINFALTGAHIIAEPQPWLASGTTVLWACLLVNVWRGSPFFMVMLLGGLQTVPIQLYEAAKIDGASVIESFIHVTLPHLRPLITTLLIFGFMGAFNFLDIILVLTRGGPANHSMILPLYAWLAAFFENRLGYSAAISVLMCAILGIFGIAVSLTRRKDD